MISQVTNFVTESDYGVWWFWPHVSGGKNVMSAMGKNNQFLQAFSKINFSSESANKVCFDRRRDARAHLALTAINWIRQLEQAIGSC